MEPDLTKVEELNQMLKAISKLHDEAFSLLQAAYAIRNDKDRDKYLAICEFLGDKQLHYVKEMNATLGILGFGLDEE